MPLFLCRAHAKWSYRLPAAALVLALLFSPGAYASPDDAERESAPVAFAVDIQAPEDIQQLLQRHLEVLRYQQLPDLSDIEMARLATMAAQNVRDLVATLGYFAPEVDVALESQSDAAPSRRLRVSVKPGPATVVTDYSIGFQGPILSDIQANPLRQSILDDWRLRPPARFTQTGWDDAKQQALSTLSTQGYATAKLSASLADIDPVASQAHLSITLDSGPLYHLGALNISGLERYDALLVERLARLEPGTRYTQNQLLEAQQRLVQSGFFNSAFLALDTDSDPTNANVLVQMREAPLKKIVLGVGASTDTGARLSIEHTHHKLPWLGWRAVSSLQLERENSNLGVELLAPPDASYWRWFTAGQIQHQALGSFDVHSQSLRAGRSKSNPDKDQNYYLQFDRADTITRDPVTLSVAQTLSANYALTLRNFDNVPFPEQGWGLGVSLGGGTTLGNRQDVYSRVALRWRGYHPLSDPQATTLRQRHAGRVVLRAETGAVMAQDGAQLPATQLFLTGGDNTVRGYGYRDLGVKVLGNEVTAGRYLVLGSIEWQRPIIRDGRLTDWESTVFLDAGAVADQPEQLQANVGLGVGARWKSPIGPLQIDLAYAVAVERLRLHINVGFNF